MEKVSVQIRPDILKRIRAEAARDDISEAQVIRRALYVYYGQPNA